LEAVSSKAGTFGMIGGQVADIKADKGRWKNIKNQEFSDPSKLLNYIHLNKTSALIQASLLAGGHLAGASRQQLKALERYGKHIGLAFQITDDILDEVGDKKKLGKHGSDKKNQKLTFPALFGLEKSRKQAAFHVSQSINSLNIFLKRADILKELAIFIINRDH
jgi:geranylgeranyl diphosphate synthase type II